jgi:plastocyanin
MVRAFKTIGPSLLMIAAIACGGSGSNTSEKPASPAAAPDAKKVDTSTAGSITGRVAFEGTPPPNAAIRMGSDPFCASAHKDGAVAQTYLVDNGGLDNVFVYVKDGLGNKYLFDTPTEAVTLDQQGCEYKPHVLGLRVGQPLQIVSSDNTTHNVHSIPETNREFNLGYPVAGMKQTVTFTAPEVLIPFKCDVHSWMNAYIGVVNHPYFAVTAGGGAFELGGVPAGTYTIEAVHEKLGRQSQSVTLGEKETKDITFTFKAGA